MQAIDGDLWRVQGPDARLPGGARLPVYATVARLADRTLAIYNPCKLDDAAAAAIEREGEVAHVIAPNLLHHLYAGQAMARWPRATLHAPPGLAAKRADLPRARSLTDPEPAWRDALEALRLAGVPKIDETIVFHRASGTLVCADFLFHVTAPANLRTRLLLRLTGTGGGELRQSRMWKLLVKDKVALGAAFAQALEWPIRQVAPVHGPHVVIDSASLAPRLRISPLRKLLGSQ
ncbi:MAG TPA: DUF4336 domain-containing protein [Kofleriaceae bacterium]|nr:DUF4336 domain-containing protein [Kofleriaceae bacterium]